MRITSRHARSDDWLSAMGYQQSAISCQQSAVSYWHLENRVSSSLSRTVLNCFEAESWLFLELVLDKLELTLYRLRFSKVSSSPSRTEELTEW